MNHYVKHEKHAGPDFLLVRRVKVTERNGGHIYEYLNLKTIAVQENKTL